jgi:hypothetical protein
MSEKTHDTSNKFFVGSNGTHIVTIKPVQASR